MFVQHNNIWSCRFIIFAGESQILFSYYKNRGFEQEACMPVHIVCMQNIVKYYLNAFHSCRSIGTSPTTPFPQYSSTPALGASNPPHPHTDTHGRPVLRAAWSEIRAEHTKNHVIKDTRPKSKSAATVRLPIDESKH